MQAVNTSEVAPNSKLLRWVPVEGYSPYLDNDWTKIMKWQPGNTINSAITKSINSGKCDVELLNYLYKNTVY